VHKSTRLVTPKKSKTYGKDFSKKVGPIGKNSWLKDISKISKS
jgi:hypothetical protein